MKSKFNRVIRFFQTLHRAAALDSLKTVLAVIGVGTVLADFSTMAWWFLLPGAVLLFGIWYADYRRHFDGESMDESLVRSLKGEIL